MQSENKPMGAEKFWVVIVAILALAGVTGSAQAVSPSNQIVVHDQNIDSGIVVIDSIVTAQDGWIVLYKDTNFSPGAIVGYAPVTAGVNTNVKVTVDTHKIGNAPTLWAILHVDNDVQGLFEWGLNNRPYNDPPVVQNGQMVLASFATTASGGSASSTPIITSTPTQAIAPVSVPARSTPPAPITNSIVVKSQDIGSGTVVIDVVTAAQDGWLVVYDNPDLLPSDEYPDLDSGEIVGYAPVKAGVTSNVKVNIETRKVGDEPTLWAVLHVDNPVTGLFEWGLKNLPYNDSPAEANGQLVIVPFGTSPNP